MGDELDFADLLGIETFYEDILSMDGVLDIVLGLLAGDEEEAEEPAEGEEPAAPAPELRLPHLDGAKLAMLGTDVVWADSYRSKSQITYEGLFVDGLSRTRGVPDLGVPWYGVPGAFGLAQ